MALPSTADQFRGLPMGDLIGGPLAAACTAQVQLASATLGSGIPVAVTSGRLSPSPCNQRLGRPFSLIASVAVIRTVNAPFCPAASDSDGTELDDDQPAGTSACTINSACGQALLSVFVTANPYVSIVPATALWLTGETLTIGA